MERLDWKSVLAMWRDQNLALFARRAHAQLGRGFVFVDRNRETEIQILANEQRPVYVTHIMGAPQALIEAVYEYDPEEEALLVSDESGDLDSITVSIVKIEKRH